MHWHGAFYLNIGHIVLQISTPSGKEIMKNIGVESSNI